MSNPFASCLDLNNRSMSYDAFERIIRALGLTECGHNRDAVYDFGWSVSTAETIYIAGEATVSDDLKAFIPTLHEVFDDIHREHMELFDTALTVIVLSPPYPLSAVRYPPGGFFAFWGIRVL